MTTLLQRMKAQKEAQSWMEEDCGPPRPPPETAAECFYEERVAIMMCNGLSQAEAEDAALELTIKRYGENL